jgi:hypothetical protein
MSFLTSAAFWLYLIAIPIIALYILKLRRRRELVSTLIFWEQIFREKRTTTLFQRLRRLLSLFLQLLFLTLMVMALARPQLAALTRRARQLIVVIDNSASMNAVDVEPSRLEAAKERALQMVDQIRFNDEMMIISCNNRPVVHIPFTNHRKSLKQAIRGINATDVATDLSTALQLALSIAQTRPNPEIVMFSDFHRIPEGLTDRKDVKIHLIRIGEDRDNVGITRFRVRKSVRNPFDYQTLLTVSNMSDETKKVNVELYLDDVLIDVYPLELAAGESKSEIYPSFNVEGGRLKAVLDISDSLPTDNVAYAVLPKRERLSVLLVTYGNLFLERVLLANESLDVTVVTPDEYPSSSEEYEVMVFDNFCPRTLKDGNYILIYPPAESSPWEVEGVLEAPIVTEWKGDHPILNYVNLQNVQLGEGYRVKPPSEAQILARSFEDPLIIAESRPNRRLVFFAFDINRSDLPLRVAFPVIMANCMSWFQSQERSLQRYIRTGEPLLTRIPSDYRGEGSVVTVVDPHGNHHPVEPKEDEVIFSGTSVAGFYEVHFGDEVELWAANLADEEESKIGPDPDLEEDLTEDLTLAKGGLLRYPLWVYFALAALMLSVTEWFLYQRRRVD